MLDCVALAGALLTVGVVLLWDFSIVGLCAPVRFAVAVEGADRALRALAALCLRFFLILCT